MAKQNITANTEYGPWSVRDGKASLYLTGEFDGATCQVKFKAPWGDVYIPDTRYQYTEDTVDVIDVGDATMIKLEFAGGGASLNVDADISS